MKKTFIMALACSLFAAGANAQTEEKYYGGEQGTFAFSINAEPVLNFAGNLLNGATYNSLDVNNLGKSIAAKFFVSDNLALKAGFSFNNTKTTSFTYFSKSDPSTYDPFKNSDQIWIDGEQEDYDYASYYKDLEKAEEKNEAPITKESVDAQRDMVLSVGAQYYIRPGKRLQPSVGADILLGRENSVYTTKSKLKDETITKTSTPKTYFGLIGNLGVEFFITEKMSLGTNLYFGLLSTSSKNISKYETNKEIWKYHNDGDDYDEYVAAENSSTKGDKELKIATGNVLAEKMGGTVSLNFYF